MCQHRIDSLIICVCGHAHEPYPTHTMGVIFVHNIVDVCFLHWMCNLSCVPMCAVFVCHQPHPIFALSPNHSLSQFTSHARGCACLLPFSTFFLFLFPSPFSLYCTLFFCHFFAVSCLQLRPKKVCQLSAGITRVWQAAGKEKAREWILQKGGKPARRLNRHAEKLRSICIIISYIRGETWGSEPKKLWNGKERMREKETWV